MASLNSPEKQPVVSDLLIDQAIKGESSPIIELACFIRRRADQFRHLSTATAVKSASDDVIRRGTSSLADKQQSTKDRSITKQAFVYHLRP